MASRARLSSGKLSALVAVHDRRPGGKANDDQHFLRHGVDVAGRDGNAFSEFSLCFAIKRPEHFGDGSAVRGGLERDFGARLTRDVRCVSGMGPTAQTALRGHERILTGSVQMRRSMRATACPHPGSHADGNTADGAMRWVDHAGLLSCFDLSKVGKPRPSSTQEC
jgi:hypothetical protein